MKSLHKVVSRSGLVGTGARQLCFTCSMFNSQYKKQFIHLLTHSFSQHDTYKINITFKEGLTITTHTTNDAHWCQSRCQCGRSTHGMIGRHSHWVLNISKETNYATWGIALKKIGNSRIEIEIAQIIISCVQIKCTDEITEQTEMWYCWKETISRNESKPNFSGLSQPTGKPLVRPSACYHSKPSRVLTQGD